MQNRILKRQIFYIHFCRTIVVVWTRRRMDFRQSVDWFGRASTEEKSLHVNIASSFFALARSGIACSTRKGHTPAPKSFVGFIEWPGECPACRIRTVRANIQAQYWMWSRMRATPRTSFFLLFLFCLCVCAQARAIACLLILIFWRVLMRKPNHSRRWCFKNKDYGLLWHGLLVFRRLLRFTLIAIS